MSLPASATVPPSVLHPGEGVAQLSA
jgi:hypothetical protein